MHPERAEGDARVVGPTSEERADVQRCLAKGVGRDRRRRRTPAGRTRFRSSLTRALGVDVRRRTSWSRRERPSSRASGRGIGQRGGPALDDHIDVLALRLVGDEHVSRAPARDVRRPLFHCRESWLSSKVTNVVPDDAFSREPQIQERLASLRVERRPRVEDVVLVGIDAAGLGREIPETRQVLLAAAHEGVVLGVRVRAVVDPLGGLKSLPIEARRRHESVLVSVAALERAAGKRIDGRRRQRRSRCEVRHQEARRENTRQAGQTIPQRRAAEGRVPRAERHEPRSSMPARSKATRAVSRLRKGFVNAAGAGFSTL